MGERLGVLPGEQENGWRELPGCLVSFFLWWRDLSHQGGSDFLTVSELDGSTSGTRTRGLTPRVVPTLFCF